MLKMKGEGDRKMEANRQLIHQMSGAKISSGWEGEWGVCTKSEKEVVFPKRHNQVSFHLPKLFGMPCFFPTVLTQRDKIADMLLKSG